MIEENGVMIGIILILTMVLVILSYLYFSGLGEENETEIRYVKMPESGKDIVVRLSECYGYECFQINENKIECFVVLGKFLNDTCIISGKMIGIDCLRNDSTWECSKNPRTHLEEPDYVAILKWDKWRRKCCLLQNISQGVENYYCWNSTFWECVYQILK